MSSGKFRSRAKGNKHDSGDHNPSQCNHEINGKYIHYKPANAREGKNNISVLGSTQARQLIIPNREPTKCFGIWAKSEFQRLQKQAYVLTQKDKIALIEEARQKKIQVQSESDKRKEILKQAQLQQRAKPGSKLTKEETDAADKNLYVLQRAFELRQEQEDEVKNATGVILAAKCLAIRQSQILEKELMKKEAEAEERRLDMMMEQERQKQLKAEEERKRIKNENSQKNVKAISQQIHEMEVQRLIDAERKEEESRNINKAMIAMQRDDAEQIRQKHLLQNKTRAELAEANANMEHFKLVQKEEVRIADLRIQEFMRNKAEREAVRAAELAEIKASKEREKARLLDTQLKAQQAQAADDEIQALRRQEEVEREWREKEKAAALKRKEQNEALKKARELQLQDLRNLQALEIQKDEQEFHKVAQVQRELYEKDLKKKRMKREAAIKHRKELLQQIDKKERDKIVKIKEKFEEGSTLSMEQEVRSINIQNVIKKKVQKLRENNVPENFVNDIERQLKVK